MECASIAYLYSRGSAARSGKLGCLENEEPREESSWVVLPYRMGIDGRNSLQIPMWRGLSRGGNGHPQWKYSKLLEKRHSVQFKWYPCFHCVAMPCTKRSRTTAQISTIQPMYSINIETVHHASNDALMRPQNGTCMCKGYLRIPLSGYHLFDDLLFVLGGAPACVNGRT